MSTYVSFESMPVWQKGMQLAERAFAITEALPRKEDYGLTSQIRRSALSVPGNIAEGFGRRHTKDKLNFYYVGYFSQADLDSLLGLTDIIWKELNKLITSFTAQWREVKAPQPQP